MQASPSWQTMYRGSNNNIDKWPAHPYKPQTVTTCWPETVTGAPSCRAWYTCSTASKVPALATAGVQDGRCCCCSCCCCRCRVPDNHLSFASAVNALPSHARVNGALGEHSPVVVWSTNKNRHPCRRSFVRSFVRSLPCSVHAWPACSPTVEMAKLAFPGASLPTPQHPAEHQAS